MEKNDGLWDWNLLTNRVYFSPRWASMVGCDGQEVGNTPEEWLSRVHPDDREQVQAGIASHLNGSAPQLQDQHRLLHKDGTYRWMACSGTAVRDAAGRAVRLKGSHFDITADKVADPLTGMPNRVLLIDRLTRAIELAKRRNDFLFAVLLIDLDRFKSTIDRLGPSISDRLLIAAARRMETSLRAVDTVARAGREHVVARLGADQFTVLLEGLREVAEAKMVAERLLRQICAPFQVEGHEVFLSASIGIALSATGYGCAEDMLRDADVAMYRAKSLGRSRCEVFDTAVADSAQVRLQLENDLQTAVAHEEIQVVYQPIVSLQTGQVAGFEALARWKHPLRGMVSPLEFIPIAERTGLIVPIGRWVLEQACRQLKQWHEELGNPNLWISVNLSSVQLTQPAILEQIEDALGGARLDPHSLILELTESAVMQTPDAVTSTLMRIRALGARIAIDDFGTGYSSLSYLRQFPADILKVDHVFVRRMKANKDTLEIVRSTVALSHQLGLQVIAEGIEGQDQLETIRGMQCEFGQGFLFAKPVGRDEARRLLTEGIAATQVLPAAAPRRRRRLLWPFAAAGVIIVAALAAGAFYLSLDLTIPAAPRGVEFTPEPIPDRPAVKPVKARPVQARPAGPPPSPAVEYASRSFPVVHGHRLGSCKGSLTISADGISFVPDKGKDGFTFKFADCAWELAKDQLTVRSANKVWRFKSTVFADLAKALGSQ